MKNVHAAFKRNIAKNTTAPQTIISTSASAFGTVHATPLAGTAQHSTTAACTSRPSRVKSKFGTRICKSTGRGRTSARSNEPSPKMRENAASPPPNSSPTENAETTTAKQRNTCP